MTVKAHQDAMRAAHTAGSITTSASEPFVAALSQVCTAAPGPCAVFCAASDALLLANAAFLDEFGELPGSRRQFEQEFEPVASPSSCNDSAAGAADDSAGHPDGVRRVEMFCPRSGRWYVFHWSRLQDPDDSPLLMLHAQNLTERMDAMRQQRALQEQLLSSSRVMSVGEMATTLAHEINQPLATIVNCLAAARTLLAQRGNQSSPRLKQALDLACEQAGQAAAVVARIREFVRTREPRREPYPLKALVERVIQLQQVEAQKHRVHISVALASDLPFVLVDRVMVEQVLSNLVRNAIEAMRTTRPSDRALTIGARRDLDGRVEVRVSDRGPGISAGNEAQLFTPFFTTKPDGMGIGLAICRSIIEFHEGHLYFERHAAGGSVFVFTLPPAAIS